MADISKAFSVENGLSFENTETGVFAGSINPITVGEAAPIGSLFVRSNGELYIKTGAGDTEWQFILRSPDITFDGLAPTTTKGDLIVRAVAGNVRLGVGDDNYVLTADASSPTGLKWAPPTSMTVSLDTGEPTGFVNRTDSTIAFSNATRIFTIAPASTEFSVYLKGKEYVKTLPESVTVPDVSDLYFIYYQGLGVLTISDNPFDWATVAPVAIIYWNATAQQATIFSEERHGITMDWATHRYLHETEGTRYGSGFELIPPALPGDGSLDAGAQVGLSGGTIHDEDIKIEVIATSTPSSFFEQDLESPAKIPVIYRLGAAGEWHRDTATSFPFKMGTTFPQYNLNTAGTWSTSEVTSGYFFSVWVVATNDVNEPVMAIIGQNQSPTLIGEELFDGWTALDLSDLPFKEFRVLWRLVYEVDSAFTNSVNCRLRSVSDRRDPYFNADAGAGSGNITDHGDLTGLSDDDHAQYVHASSPRTISAQHQFAPSSVQAPFTLGINAQGQLVTGLNADLLDGQHASAFQPIDADLTSISGINTVGFLARTGTNTWATRSITGTAGNISVTNGTGAVNPTTIDLVSTGIAPGTYKSLTIDAFGRATAGTNPTTLLGYGIVDAQPLDDFLTSISGVSASGIMVKDGDDLLVRSIVAGSSKIVITNTTGVAGDVVIDLAPIAIDDLSDVAISSASIGQSLVFNGTTWANADTRLKLYAENPVTPSAPTAVGDNSIAFGTEAQADADESFAFGRQSLARFPGITQANGRFGSQGDAQSGRYLLRSTSINASQTELFLDGTGGSQRLALPADSTWVFEITIIGHRTDASDGRAGFRLKGIVYRQGTINIALLGTPTKDILARTSQTLNAFVAAEDGALKVKVIGETGKTYRWLAIVDTVEVTN